MTRHGIIAIVVLAFVLAPAALLADDATLARIEQAINDKGLNWTPGPAFFSLADFRARLGMHLAGGENQVCGAEDNENRLLSVPSSLNYVTQGDVTSVKDQGQCGGCWAFAAVAALESAAIIESGYPQSINLSEQYLLGCDSGESGCGGAYDLDQPMDFLCSTGTVDASCFPYAGQDSSCTPCGSYQSDIYTGAAHGDVTQTVDALKQGLVTYGPIAVSMEVFDDFNYYTSGVYSYAYGNDEGAHAVLLVGYDDGGSYFLVKNSWSAAWGMNGYFEIAYSEVTGSTNFGANAVWIQFSAGPNSGGDDDNDNDTNSSADDDLAGIVNATKTTLSGCGQ